MVEIILDSTHSFIEAQVELKNIENIAGTENYKTKVMTIHDAEDWKTYKQMKAIRSMIQELWNSGEHSCPIEKVDLEEFTDYVKKDVIKLLILKKVWDRKNQVFKERYEAKSMKYYTKGEMTQAITNMITYIDNCGCNTKKMEEIRGGMERDKIGYRV